ncbi:hypothetical protein [Streptosporangium sp. NPDC002544]|uniref:hypothetical protein n=1 Tax=unclassified Streptosporangium TaxID=2632669 RepID=UPI00332668D3
MNFDDWEHAHTDYVASTTRPGPAGLATSDADWRHHLEHDTPNGWLLRPDGNAMLRTLTSRQPIYLMHMTRALEAIRTSGQVSPSAGCLVGALYCAPLTAEPDGLRPHNLGAYLLETKRGTQQPLVIEIPRDTPMPAKGLDYLRLGGIHLRTYLTHRAFLTDAEDARLRLAAVDRVRTAAGFLDLLMAIACERVDIPDGEFVDRLAAAVPIFPYIGYLYFEVLSEYLLLHSTAPQTKAYADAGEMNNRLYKQIAFSAVATMGRLFDLALFNPDHRQLLHLVGQVEPGLAAGAPAYTRRRLPYLFTCLALPPGQDATSVTFHGADFDTLTEVAPHLLGQLVFRDMRTSARYPRLYPAVEQAKALEAHVFWNSRHIPAPFNGVLPKGEIGVNPAWPASPKVWAVETCDRGLLHPVEQLDVIFVPRLTDLYLTAIGHAGPPKNAATPTASC